MISILRIYKSPFKNLFYKNTNFNMFLNFSENLEKYLKSHDFLFSKASLKLKTYLWMINSLLWVY